MTTEKCVFDNVMMVTYGNKKNYKERYLLLSVKKNYGKILLGFTYFPIIIFRQDLMNLNINLKFIFNFIIHRKY